MLKLLRLRVSGPFNTVPTHNKHFSHYEHTLFANLCLFGEGEDFGKIYSLYFFKIESLKTHFLLFLKNCVMQDCF